MCVAMVGPDADAGGSRAVGHQEKTMSTSTERATGRVRRALIMTAATVGIGAGLLPGTAHAATPISFAALRIEQGTCPANYKNVFMDASVQMSRADAQRFVDNPGSEVEIRLMGDDWRDNVEHGPVAPERFVITDFGLMFAWSKCVPHTVLNEDPARGDGDELYARFTFRDIRDGTTTTANSRNVNGNY